jgi:hypothetical protein
VDVYTYIKHTYIHTGIQAIGGPRRFVSLLIIETIGVAAVGALWMYMQKHKEEAQVKTE